MTFEKLLENNTTSDRVLVFAVPASAVRRGVGRRVGRRGVDCVVAWLPP